MDGGLELREAARKIGDLHRDLACFLRPIFNPKPQIRTFDAGGLTITAPLEESLAAERWIKLGSGAEMTTDRLNEMVKR